jgi:hypothetical protein
MRETPPDTDQQLQSIRICGVISVNRLVRLTLIYTALLTLWSTPGNAAVSANLPLDDPAYALLEKLVTSHLTFRNALTIKPITRLSAAQLIAEAIRQRRHERESDQREAPFIDQTLQHLAGRFKAELRQIGFFYQPRRPRPIVLTLPGELKIDMVGAYDPFVQRDANGNLQGVFSLDEGFAYGKDFSMRLRAASWGTFWQDLAAYVEGETLIRSDPIVGDSFDGRLHKGYLKMSALNLELEFGRDTMWWGPASQGDLVLSANAAPLDLLKVSTPRPFRLPGLAQLGEWQLAYFAARLENNRAISHALLNGFRATYQPISFLQLGYTGAFQAYGEDGVSLGTTDYVSHLFAPPLNNKANSANGLAAFDVVLSVPLISKISFLHGAKFYWQRGQDSNRDMGGVLGGGNILGGMIDGGRWDARIEFAETHDQGATWYTHPRYQSGVAFKRFFLGHPIGGDAESIFGRATYYLQPTTWAALDGRRDQYDTATQSASTTQHRFGLEASHLLFLKRRHLTLWGRLEYATLDRPQDNLEHTFNVRLSARLRF